MTEWDDIFRSSVFHEAGDPANRFKNLSSLDDSLTAPDEPSHGNTSNVENSWEAFCLQDSSESTAEVAKPASFASLRALSPARISPPYPATPKSSAFNAEKAWEAYGKDNAMNLPGMLDEKKAIRTQNLGEELALWFGNLENLPQISTSPSFSPFMARQQDSSDGTILDDAASNSGTFNSSSPSIFPANRSGSFNSSSPRSTRSTSSMDGGENEIEAQDDYQPAAAPRRGRRKSTAKCSHSKHCSQAERTRAANRAAAHRYREKRRAATNALEDRVKELEAEKRSLNATIGTLHSALLSLSEEVSRHS